MTIDNETRRNILDTALALFTEHGFDGVSTTDIARAADVNKALIFYYFGSKKELYRESFRAIRDTFIERLRTQAPTGPSGSDRIEAFIRAHIGLLRENPAMVNYLIRELIAAQSGSSLILDDLLEMFRLVQQRLGGTVREGVENGTFRKIDPLQTVISIVSLDVFFFLQKPLLMLMGFDKLPNSSAFEVSREDHVIDLVMNGIRNREDTA